VKLLNNQRLHGIHNSDFSSNFRHQIRPYYSYLLPLFGFSRILSLADCRKFQYIENSCKNGSAVGSIPHLFEGSDWVGSVTM